MDPSATDVSAAVHTYIQSLKTPGFNANAPPLTLELLLLVLGWKTIILQTEWSIPSMPVLNQDTVR